jgi:hypothetical protein
MDNVHTNQVFAPIDPDHTLERVAGGNETEVYRSDDGTWVAKLKSELGSDAAGALAEAQAMRAAAEDFAACLGPMFSIPSDFIIASDDAGRCQILVMQPYLQGARSLYELDYATLSASQRSQLATQLRVIIDRSLAHYRATGSMPDLYGRTSANQAERRRLNGAFGAFSCSVTCCAPTTSCSPTSQSHAWCLLIMILSGAVGSIGGFTMRYVDCCSGVISC